MLSNIFAEAGCPIWLKAFKAVFWKSAALYFDSKLIIACSSFEDFKTPKAVTMAMADFSLGDCFSALDKASFAFADPMLVKALPAFSARNSSFKYFETASIASSFPQF